MSFAGSSSLKSKNGPQEKKEEESEEKKEKAEMEEEDAEDEGEDEEQGEAKVRKSVMAPSCHLFWYLVMISPLHMVVFPTPTGRR